MSPVAHLDTLEPPASECAAQQPRESKKNAEFSGEAPSLAPASSCNSFFGGTPIS
jgi:hypothetical protein